MRTCPVAAIFLAMVIPSLHADDRRPALAEELLSVIRMGKLIQSGWTSYAPLTSRPVASQPPAQEAPEHGTPSNRYWEKVKPDYIKAYAEVFTEEQLQQLIAFYKSPVGQMYLEKQPALAAKTAEISQKYISEFLKK